MAEPLDAAALAAIRERATQAEGSMFPPFVTGETVVRLLDAYTHQQEEIQRLRDALKRYAMCDEDCAGNQLDGNDPCDCGLRTILAPKEPTP